MQQRITKKHLAYQLEIFANRIGKETREQLIARIIEARQASHLTKKQAKEYWTDPEYIENIDSVLDIGEYLGVYKITNGDGYFSGKYGHAATSKRAIYDVLCMVNEVLREQVNNGEMEDLEWKKVRKSWMEKWEETC